MTAFTNPRAEPTSPPSRDDLDIELVGSSDKPSSAERTLRAWVFTPDDMTEQATDDALPRIPADGQGVLWVDLGDYGEQDLRELMELFELDPAGIRAALAPWQRPSVASFANHAFVNVTVLDLDLDHLALVANEIDCFVLERCILTAHRHDLPFFDNILGRAAPNVAAISADPAYLLYILLDELVDDFAVLADELDEHIEDLEVEALTATDADFVDHLVRHKRLVYTAGRLVGQHRSVFHGLLRPDFPFVSGATVEGYFAELADRFAAVAGTFEQARQEVAGTFDIYLSSVAHRTNGVMKSLTMLSILVLPATAIFGFFGSNFVHLPLFGTAGFVVMILLLVALTVGQLLLFRRRGWLS